MLHLACAKLAATLHHAARASTKQRRDGDAQREPRGAGCKAGHHIAGEMHVQHDAAQRGHQRDRDGAQQHRQMPPCRQQLHQYPGGHAIGHQRTRAVAARKTPAGFPGLAVFVQRAHAFEHCLQRMIEQRISTDGRHPGSGQQAFAADQQQCGCANDAQRGQHFDRAVVAHAEIVAEGQDVQLVCAFVTKLSKAQKQASNHVTFLRIFVER